MAEAPPLHVKLRRDHQVGLFLAFLLIVTIPVAIGLWRAQEWARWTFGLLAAGLMCLGVARLFHHEMAFDWGTAGRMGMALMWGIVALQLLHPGAKESFAAARESIARTRVTPA